VVVDSLRPLDMSRIGPAAEVIPLLVSDPGAPDAKADAKPDGRDFAAVAPPVQSFAQGRRR
jgi:hypothetical protein